jgi:rod shape-determining protein MreD
VRGLIGAAVVAVAVALQLAVADRIIFPGGTGPDLVLLTVAALALATGPMAGAVLGFCGGLALDVAPPAGHLVGQDALVFCLIGYACGLLASGPGAEGLPDQEHSALFELGVTAVGAVCGEAMTAGLGVMLSDPRVSWLAVKHVLPVAVGYDLLLSPFVLLTVAAMLRVAGFVSPHEASAGARGTSGRSIGARGLAGRPAAWAGGAAAAGAVRQIAGGGSPRLRLSGQGKGGDGWLSGGHGAGSRSGPGRSGLTGPGNNRPGTPRLKLGGSGGALSGAGGRRGGAGRGPGPARVRFGARRGEGVVGGSLLGSGGAVGFRRAGDRLASSRLGASLLGGSVFGRSSSIFARSSASGLGRPAGPFGGTSVGFGGRSSSFTGKSLRGLSKGSLSKGSRSKGSMSGGAGAHAPRFRKEGTLARMVHGTRRPGQRKSPGKGWLRGSRPGRGPVRSLAGNGISRRSPGRGWLRGSSSFRGSGGAIGLGGKSGLGSLRSKSSLRSRSGLRGKVGLGKGGLGGKSAFGGRSPFGGRSSFGRGRKSTFGASGATGQSRIRLGRTRKRGGYR